MNEKENPYKSLRHLEHQLDALGAQYVTYLAQADRATACRWWATFNRWEWPEDLPPKPGGFADLPNSTQGIGITKMDIVWPLMEKIKKKHGRRACLEAWNQRRRTLD